MTETVLVVAKAPSPGRSKTRLVPPLTPEQAAALHEVLLLDTLDSCRAECDDVRLLHASEDDAAELGRIAPGVPLVAQEGRGLAAALQRGIASHVGHGQCVIVSSDVPGLPAGAHPDQPVAAVQSGAEHDIGATAERGERRPNRSAHEAPFRAIPWSTPAVLAVTRMRCAEAGLELVELEPWQDVDTLVDLAALATGRVLSSARRTAELLRELDGDLPRSAGVELLA